MNERGERFRQLLAQERRKKEMMKILGGGGGAPYGIKLRSFIIGNSKTKKEGSVV